jgi:hypothetical protein
MLFVAGAEDGAHFPRISLVILMTFQCEFDRRPRRPVFGMAKHSISKEKADREGKIHFTNFLTAGGEAAGSEIE